MYAALVLILQDGACVAARSLMTDSFSSYFRAHASRPSKLCAGADPGSLSVSPIPGMATAQPRFKLARVRHGGLGSCFLGIAEMHPAAASLHELFGEDASCRHFGMS